MPTRRKFVQTVLSGCASSIPLVSAIGQILPSDNPFQVRESHLYSRDGAELRQILLTSSRGVDPSATLEVSIGKRTDRHEVRKLRQIGGQYYIPIAPLEQTEFARFILSNGSKTQETQLQIERARKWNVFLVHNSHQDLGFVDLPSSLRSRYHSFIDDAMKYCEETRDLPEAAQFKWNIETGYLVEDYRKASSDEKFRTLMDWVKKGRIAIGALYCNAQTDFMSLETLNRLLYYVANDLAREFGITTEGAMLDDVPGFTWALVEVLAKSGVPYLVFGANGWRNNIQDAPILFYLEGPEGREVLIWRSASYAEGISLVPQYVDPYLGGIIRGLNIQDGEAAIAPFLARYELAEYPFDAILLQAAADSLPPQKSLCEVVQAWNSLWAYPHLRISTTPEFFHFAEKNFRDRIPRFRGGVPDGWVDLHIGEANAAALARRTQDALPDAERLATLGLLAGVGPARASELANAYNELALWEEHTFEWDNFRLHRADIYAGESQGGGKLHWEEKLAHVQAASRVADEINKQSVEALCRNISTRTNLTLIVVNPLSWVRDEIVRTPLPASAKPPLRVLDQESGAEIPCQVDGETLVFLAERVPALGYRTYALEPAQTQPASKPSETSPLTLENGFYRIELRPEDGTVRSLFDKALQKEFVDNGAAYGLNALVYRVDNRTNVQSITNARDYATWGTMPVGDISILPGAAGPVYSSIRVKGKIGYVLDFEHEILLYAKSKRIEFFNRIQKRPAYTYESVFHAFPFSIPYESLDTYKLDVPGAILRPDVDQIPGSFRDTYAIQHWVSVSRKDYGVIWASADAPLVELGGIQVEKHLPHLLAAFDNALASGGIFAFLMSNHTTVDAPVAQGGDYLFRYAMTTHGAEWTQNAAHQFGWSFMSPLSTYLSSSRREGEWKEPSRCFVEINPENVYLAGFKEAGNREGVILRLYEGAGLYTDARVAFHLPGRTVRAAWACDNAGEQNQTALKAVTDSFRIALMPYETATVRVILS